MELSKQGEGRITLVLENHASGEDLHNHTRAPEIESGVVVRVLDLGTQIAIKDELGPPKDTAVLPLLRRALRERSENFD